MRETRSGCVRILSNARKRGFPRASAWARGGYLYEAPAGRRDPPRRGGLLQGIVDGYYAQLQRVCARHDRCWTDEGAIRRMPLRPGDLTADSHHLTVPGLAVMARYVWKALPAAIKDRA